MPGFFHEIRSLFPAKYSGRYLALLLRELGRAEPAQFARACRLRLSTDVHRRLIKGQLQIEREWRYRRDRKADLAILDSGEPVVLMEIKEDDVGNPRNFEQLTDYLDFCADVPKGVAPPHFVHVSRFAPSRADRERLTTANADATTSLRYRDIYTALVRTDMRDAPITRMLCDYLEDIGVAAYEALRLDDNKGKSVDFMVSQLLGFPHQSGLKKLHSDAAINELPRLLKVLFGNLEVMSEWFKEGSPEVFRKRFTRKLLPVPEFHIARLRSRLQKANIADIDELPGRHGEFVQAGSLYCYAMGKVAADRRAAGAAPEADWLYLEIGYRFYLECGKQEKTNDAMPHAELSLYVTFNSSASDDSFFAEKTVATFPSEQRARSVLADCLARARKKLLGCPEIPAHFKRPVAAIEF